MFKKSVQWNLSGLFVYKELNVDYDSQMSPHTPYIYGKSQKYDLCLFWKKYLCIFEFFELFHVIPRPFT